jgi:hypothetical protein
MSLAILPRYQQKVALAYPEAILANCEHVF